MSQIPWLLFCLFTCWTRSGQVPSVFDLMVNLKWPNCLEFLKMSLTWTPVNRAHSLEHSLGNSLTHGLGHSLERGLHHCLENSLQSSLENSLEQSLEHSLKHGLGHSQEHGLQLGLETSLLHSLGHSLEHSPLHSLKYGLAHTYYVVSLYVTTIRKYINFMINVTSSYSGL